MNVHREPVDRKAIQRSVNSAGIELLTVTSPSANLALWHAGTGPTVLLLHGVTYSSLSVFDLEVRGYDRKEFSLILRLAAAGFSVYALDFEGYGLSETRAGEASVDGYCLDVLYALHMIERHSGFSKTNIVGWSWGAQVGARFAGMWPERVERLVFWGSFWGGSRYGAPYALRNMIPPSTPRRLNNPLHAGADFRTSTYYDDAVREAFISRALSIDPTSPTLGLHAVACDVPLHNPSKLTMPVLAVHGSNDPMSTREDILEFLASVPHSKVYYELIADADHNAQFCHNRRNLDQVISKFLREE